MFQFIPVTKVKQYLALSFPWWTPTDKKQYGYEGGKKGMLHKVEMVI